MVRVMTHLLRFYARRLCSTIRMRVDRCRNIDERCEACSRVLVVDGVEVGQSVVVDFDGTKLCLFCATVSK